MPNDPQPTINIVSGDDCGYVDNPAEVATDDAGREVA